MTIFRLNLFIKPLALRGVCIINIQTYYADGPVLSTITQFNNDQNSPMVSHHPSIKIIYGSQTLRRQILYILMIETTRDTSTDLEGINQSNAQIPHFSNIQDLSSEGR